MNLFIGVILDGFDEASKEDTDVITQEDFDRFSEHWATFDPFATSYISVQASFFFFLAGDVVLCVWVRHVRVTKKPTTAVVYGRLKALLLCKVVLLIDPVLTDPKRYKM